MGPLTEPATMPTALSAEPLYLLINQHFQVSRQPGSTRRWIAIPTIRSGAAAWWPKPVLRLC